MSDLIRQTIDAGANLSLRREAGLFLLNEAEAPLRVKLYRAGTAIFDASGVGRGVKVRPEGGFDQVEIINTGGVALYVEAFVCAGDVDVQIATGIEVTVDNEAANAVPVAGPVTNAELRASPVVVDVQGATLTASGVVLENTEADPAIVRLTDSGVMLENTEAAPAIVRQRSGGTVTDTTAAPGAVAAVFAAADDARRSLRIKNTGAVDVAVGGAGVAFATAAVVLMPGELWVESEGAGAAWYAVTESAAGSLAVQGVA